MERKKSGAAYLDLGIAQLALVELGDRNDTAAPTSEQKRLIQSALDSLNQYAMVSGVNESSSHMIDAENAINLMTYFSAQQPDWESVHQSIRIFREYIGMSPSERQNYGGVLFLCFLLRSALSLETAHAHPDLPRKLAPAFQELLRSPQVKNYPALSLMVKQSLGDTLLIEAQFEAPQESEASLRRAVQEYREVIADQQTAGESPSVINWGLLAEALQRLAARESGSTGTSRLVEAVSILAPVLYPYDPAHASQDWFLLQRSMANALLPLGGAREQP